MTDKQIAELCFAFHGLTKAKAAVIRFLAANGPYEGGCVALSRSCKVNSGNTRQFRKTLDELSEAGIITLLYEELTYKMIRVVALNQDWKEKVIEYGKSFGRT